MLAGNASRESPQGWSGGRDATAGLLGDRTVLVLKEGLGVDRAGRRAFQARGQPRPPRRGAQPGMQPLPAQTPQERHWACTSCGSPPFCLHSQADG